MDQEQFQQLSAAPYPAPPPFWKHFTAENVNRMIAVDSNRDLPFEINSLRPPPPPAPEADLYKTFSTNWRLDPTPEFPPSEILLFEPSSSAFNPAKALKQLTTSLLLNFLELLSVLSNNPMKYEGKMQDIEQLMLNVHFVINLYRPHQAREGVKEMLQNQLDNGRREIQKCDEVRQRIDDFLTKIQQYNAVPDVQIAGSGSKDQEKQRDKRLWTLIQELQEG